MRTTGMRALPGRGTRPILDSDLLAQSESVIASLGQHSLRQGDLLEKQRPKRSHELSKAIKCWRRSSDNGEGRRKLTETAPNWQRQILHDRSAGVLLVH